MSFINSLLLPDVHEFTSARLCGEFFGTIFSRSGEADREFAILVFVNPQRYASQPEEHSHAAIQRGPHRPESLLCFQNSHFNRC